MIFDREITVYVTAHSDGERRFWAGEFEALFVNATITECEGSYALENGAVVREKVITVSHLFTHNDTDRAWKWHEVDQLLYNYKREAKQESALSVTREVRGTLV
jgi:hypothetical protein